MKLLQKIGKEHAYDQLDLFKDSSAWSLMDHDEKTLLAILFIGRGKNQLEARDPHFIDSFDIASQLAPELYDIHYLQGKACAEHLDNVHCLTLASQAYSKAVACKPDGFESWFNWGDVLIFIGLFYQEVSYLAEADHKFQMAEAILRQRGPLTSDDAIVYWRWGLCWSLMARQAGEPQDLRIAIDKYKQAESLGFQDPDFWHDYGSTLLELGMLIQRPELLVDASDLYHKALERSPDSFEYWFSLACCYQYLYEINLDESYFERSHAAFDKASKVESNESRLWLKWGQLLIGGGKATRNLEKIKASLAKFEKANACESNNPLILSRWGEAEMIIGTNLDRLDHIRSAESKIVKSLEIFPESPDIWFFYGACLNALGHYFHEDEYYNQAIEKFQYGLSLDRHHPLLWYGLGMAHYSLGDRWEDIPLLEKAVRDFAHVIECGGGSFAQFWNDWGVAYMKLGEVTDTKEYVQMAIEKFERALKHPTIEKDKGNVDLEWVYNYGCAFDFLGEFTGDESCYERAVFLLSQVIQADPKHAHAGYNLALALSHLAEAMSDVTLYEKAIEQYLIILGRDNEDELACYDLGMTYIHLANLVQDKHHLGKNQALLHLAEHRLLQSAALGNPHAHYAIACLFSLAGNFDAAMHYIERAQHQGTLPSIDEMMREEWLSALRQTPAFRQFITHLSSQ